MPTQSWDKRPEQQSQSKVDSLKQTQSEADTLKEFHSELSKLERLTKELNTNNTLSDADREKKEKEAQDSAEKLQWQVDKLRVSAWLDAKIVAERERAENLLKSRADTLSLQSSIWDKSSEWAETDKEEVTTQPTSTEVQSAVAEIADIQPDKIDEKKWFLWKTWEWFGRHWSKIAAGIAWLWIWSLIFRKKKDKKKEEKESDKGDSKKDTKDEKKWWKKVFLWTWIGAWTVFGWVELFKNWNTVSSWVKEKLWLSLNFNEALVKVENEVKGWKVDTKDFWTFRAHFEWMSYVESTGELCSFWEKTKINKDGKSIAWMDNVHFASREELFHAVNIVNFAKRELKWRWGPFTVTDKWWDIDFKIAGGWNEGFISANWSDFRSKTLWTAWAWAWWLLGWYFLWVKWWVVWAVWGWMAWYAAWSIIDNSSAMWRACGTIAKWANLDRFVNYLNDLNIWEPKPQEKEPDNQSPIHKYLNQVIDEIEWTRWPQESRDLCAEYDENNPSEVVIKSYHQEVKLKLEWNTAKIWEEIDFNKITKISLLRYAEDKDEKCDLDIDFPHNEEWLKETIRVANFTNMIREKFKKAWHVQYPFWYWRFSTPMGFDIANERKFDIGGLNSVNLSGVHCTILLENSTLKEKYPTLHKDLKRSSGIFWLPTLGSQFSTGSNQDKQHESVKEDSSKWSQYIKYLNQMSGWMYRWNKAH